MRTSLGLKTTNKKYLFIIFPSICNFLSSTLQYLALYYLNPSIFQMMRGGIVIVTAIFSKVFLKKILYPHNYLGMILVVLGISLTGAANFMFPNEQKSNSNVYITIICSMISHIFYLNQETETILATLLLLVAQIFNGGILFDSINELSICLKIIGIFILEEKAILTYHVSTYEVIGTEGFWVSSVHCLYNLISTFIGKGSAAIQHNASYIL